LQFQKHQEDSAILLASNKPHNKDQTNKTKKDRKGKEHGKTKNKWAYRKLPAYMT
jgi:hypothetical protein